MDAAALNDHIAELFREAFEGVAPGSSGTWFVEGKEGILDALDSVTPAQASYVGEGWRSSFGAHVRHLDYYLSLFNAGRRGEQVKPDWEGSWAVQEFDQAAWDELKAKTKADFEEALATYRSDVLIDLPAEQSYTIPNLVHAAFHLGAIRALLPIAQTNA